MEVKDEATEAGEGLRKHRRLLRDRPPVPSSDESTGGRIEGYLPRPYPARETRRFGQDLLGVLLFFSMAFNVLDAEPFRIIFHKWMPGLKVLPTRRAMSGTVLQRLLGALLVSVNAAYCEGAYVSISFDGGKIVAGRTLMGVLALLFGQPGGTVMVDFLGTTDITKLPEATEFVVLVVDRALESARVRNSFLPRLPSGTRDDSCP